MQYFVPLKNMPKPVRDQCSADDFGYQAILSLIHEFKEHTYFVIIVQPNYYLPIVRIYVVSVSRLKKKKVM